MACAEENSEADLGKMKLNRILMQFYQTGGKEHEKLLLELELINNEEPNVIKPIVLYNIATVYFHRQMYFTAMDTLQPLLKRLDSIDMKIAAPAGILMLRLLIATNHVNKARAFAQLLQQKFRVNFKDSLMHDEQSQENMLTIAGSPDLARSFQLLYTMAQVLSRNSVVIPEDGSPEYNALKAHQYYIMKDFQLASKQLKKINDEVCKNQLGTDLGTCLANNMGVIHLRVRHYAIAAKFFQNALIFDKHISENLRNAELQNMSTARSCEILYNLGISMLHLKRPNEAFQCFLVPLKSYPSNARLWFRIAEACIMDQEIKDVELEHSSLGILLAAAGKRRRLILKQKPRLLYNDEPPGMPESSLEFAALCLRNALTLTLSYKRSFYEEKSDKSNVGTNIESTDYVFGANNRMHAFSRNVRDNNFCNPSKPISKKSLDNLLSAIYAAYSYVLINIGDYVRALEMAYELLKQDRLSDAHKMLAHMYVAEALILLERPHHEARPHLEQHLDHLNAFDFETRDWKVKSVDAAQNVLRYNLAVATALVGDIEKAQSMLSTCKHPIVAPKVVALKMHIELKKVT